VAQLPPLTERLDWNYGQVVRLVGYQVGDRNLQAGQDKVVTLCWETLSTPDKDYAFALHIVAPDGSMIGARDSYHGLGRYPSSAWREGDCFCDQVRVGITDNLALAQLYQMVVTVYDPNTLEALPTTDAAGASAPTFVGWLKTPSMACFPEDALIPSADIRFGETISLLAYTYQASPEPQITLYWQASGSVGGNFSIFVHVIDEAGRIATQADSQPRGGLYPTWLWEPGEVIEDTHPLDIDALSEARDYRVWVGLYDPVTAQRLPLMVSGRPVADNAFELRGVSPSR